jgi:hypothetical protein
MKLTMYCNGNDEPECTCEGGSASSIKHDHPMVDDIDP